MKNLYKLFGIFSLVLIFTFFVKGDALAASPVAGNGSATIWWKTANGVASYNLYFREAGEKMFTHSVPNVPANAVSYTIKYLKPGVTYVYNLAAVDGSGKEYWWSGEKKFWSGSKVNTWSGTAAAPKAQAAQPAQQVQTATPIAGWASATAWIKPVSGAQSYNVYYREAGQKGYWYSVPGVPSNAMSVKINYLKNGVTYYYNVATLKDGKEWWQGEKVLTWGTPAVQIVKLNKNMMIDNPSMGATPKSMPINQPKATGAAMMEKKAPSTPSGSTGGNGY